MNKIITRLRQFDKLTVWLSALLLLLVLVMVTVVLSLHFRNAGKKADPEVTLQAKNSFPRTLRVVGDMDYKPFSYFNERSVPCGYDIELVIELVNRLHCNVKLTLVNWNDAVKMIQEKKADVILGCDWQDATVMDCNFTIPTFEEKFVVFQEKPFNVFSDLYSKRIAVIKGCGLKGTLEKYQLWKNCVEYPTVTDCVRSVLDGKSDCFIAHHTIGEICLREFGDRGKRFNGRLDFASGQMCMGIAKDEHELFEKINKELIEIRADGTLDKLERKWIEHFVEDVSLVNYLRKHPLTMFGFINLSAIVVLVLIIMWKERNHAIAAEKARSMFFSIVSHDIRTPLNAILGYSALLKSGIKSEEEREEAIDSISASGTTLLQLVNDVLDLAKIDSGKMTLHLEPVDLAQLTDDVFASFQLTAREKGIELVNRTADVPTVMLDAHRFRQILFNLTGNAVKFTEHGSVTVAASYTDTNLEVSVSDTGCGIPPDMLTRVLDPFVQVQDPTHSADRTMGTGLGLSICRSIAETMGGELFVESELGKGSKFRVCIPGVATDGEKAVTAGGQTSADVPGGLPKHVLVVDDSPVNRKVLTAFLKKAGVVSIGTASDGGAALSELDFAVKNGNPYDLVFSDLWMPNMNGMEFIEKLRAISRFSQLPVFALTADTEFHGDSRTDLFTGVLLKPVTYEKLVDVFTAVK